MNNLNSLENLSSEPDKGQGELTDGCKTDRIAKEGFIPTEEKEALSQMVAEALHINKSSVTSIEPLAGLTNKNYKIVIGEKEYAVRVPGKGTEKYLNRASEKMVSEKVSDLGINPKVTYFNEKTGLKIVEYIPEAKTLNANTGKREENLAMVAEIFRKLHQSGEKFDDRFDVFEKITEYEEVLKDAEQPIIEGYNEVKKEVLQLKDDYLSLNVPLAPCHIDPLTENFVKSGENNMYLIDWEYAGMNDPFWDVAAYIVETELSEAEEKIFLLEYFNGEIHEKDLRRLLMNKIFQDFLWTIWALMKEQSGDDLGSYAKTRFTRAKKNLKEIGKVTEGTVPEVQ